LDSFVRSLGPCSELKRSRDAAPSATRRGARDCSRRIGSENRSRTFFLPSGGHIARRLQHSVTGIVKTLLVCSDAAMSQPSPRPPLYKGYRFPPEIISHCVWLYYRFVVSLRDVSELMLARGIEVSYEAIRLWTLRFGLEYARRSRR